MIDRNDSSFDERRTIANCLVYKGDITELALDAIVNAANSSLLGGGGVDGAIHRAAGKELLEACRKLGGCKTGDAKTTPGFNRPARFVTHTAGPVWRGGSSGEAEALASCYRRSLELAIRHDIGTIAFPAISTGVYGYPPGLAAEIAASTVKAFLDGFSRPLAVTFCCFSEASASLHQRALDYATEPSHATT